MLTEEQKKEKQEIAKLKMEIAKELGLEQKIEEKGWKALSAKETGRIGGLMTNRRKKMKKDKA